MPLPLPRPGPRVRQVGKVVLAALTAYSLSQGQRNEHALFAALGAAMVVGGSLGEDLRSSLVRVRGTLAGTAVGIAAAQLLGTSLAALGVVVGTIAWLCVGLGWGAPAMRVGLAWRWWCSSRTQTTRRTTRCGGRPTR